jgi:uncharacterized protein DUF6894
MPQYFFDVRDRGQLFADEEGQELPDVASAEIEAAEAAMAIGRDLLPTRHGGELVVEVRNERRERVLTVNVELHIARQTAVS